MDNELIDKKTWWKSNWKWFLPISLLFLLLSFGFLLRSNLVGNMTDITKAYSDNALYEKAIELANANKKVQEAIGNINPIDPLAILEGNTIYSNNNNSVVLSIRINGAKGKGKMDISAERNGTKWHYKEIKIRIKESREEIQIFKDLLETK
jgi:hypothetical protein